MISFAVTDLYVVLVVGVVALTILSVLRDRATPEDVVAGLRIAVELSRHEWRTHRGVCRECRGGSLCERGVEIRKRLDAGNVQLSRVARRQVG